MSRVPPQMAGAYMRENLSEAIAAATPKMAPPMGQPPGPAGPGGPQQGALGGPPPAAPGPSAPGGTGLAGPPTQMPPKPGQTLPMQLAANKGAPPFAAALQGPRGIEAQMNKPVGFARGGFVCKR